MKIWRRAERVPAIIVIAKAPRPGYVKTRLSPPCSITQAAALAEAALTDTLKAVAETRGIRRVLALDGAPGPWLLPGFTVIAQRGEGLAERLAAAFADCGGRGLVIGMDTPQVTPALLRSALDALAMASSVLGLARDGGWWGLGLRAPDARVFHGVPMSTPQTGALQLIRLRALHGRPAMLPILRDVDTIDDALAVAREIPDSQFAAAVSAVRVPARAS